jgi:hypothetical protein
MKTSSMLQSPAALILQGFVAGGIIFFALNPLSGAERQPSPIGETSVLETLQAS